MRRTAWLIAATLTWTLVAPAAPAGAAPSLAIDEVEKERGEQISDADATLLVTLAREVFQRR